MNADTTNAGDDRPNMFLFWGCFLALIATAFGFIVRALIIGEWGTEFELTPTQQGEIFGVGLWPFAVSIIVWSLFIDHVGYKPAMIFGFVCHVASAIITIFFAKGYWGLWLGTFIVALGNGTVEAYINPVVATMFSKDKTKWLNILHAGWPGGLVLGGLLTLTLSAINPDVNWRLKVGLLLIPTICYFFMLIGVRFPINERVAAGVSYRDMLREVGGAGMTVIAWMSIAEVGRVLMALVGQEIPGNWLWMSLGIAAVVGVCFGVAVGGVGRPMFLLFLLIMIPLATTELGVDSWVTELMTPAMGKWAPWLLVYTSAIMTVLRFFAGPIVGRLTPLGTLATCSLLAAGGLYWLSGAEAASMILIAATIYGVGKTFFWPTTLGIVAEQFPRGGAMTLNGVSAVGMLGVGVLGAQLLGAMQDRTIDAELAADYPEIHGEVLAEKQGLFGKYQSVDTQKVAELPEQAQATVKEIQDGSKKSTLAKVTVFPLAMFVCYVLLIIYFQARGGYRPVELAAGAH